LSPRITWQRLSECLGMSEYEARAYLSLVEAGAAKASTISMKCGVPRTKIYSILRRLTDVGLAVEIPGEPRKFAPAPPKTAFEAHLRSYEQTVKNLLSVVSSLDEVFRRVSNEVTLQQGTIWVIKGEQESLGKIGEMLTQAKSSVDLATHGKGMILFYRTFDRLLDELAERSIKVRVMTPFRSCNCHILNELRDVGEVEDTEYHSPTMFLVTDNRWFLLADLKGIGPSSDLTIGKSIFSDDPRLLEMVDLLIPRKTHLSPKPSTFSPVRDAARQRRPIRSVPSYG